MPRTEAVADLTVNDVAGRLHLEPRRVRELLTDGQLQGYKTGRKWFMDEAALVSYLASVQPRAGRQVPDGTSAPLSLAALNIHARGMKTSPGSPTLRPVALSWVIVVRMENTGQAPLSFGDIHLNITGDEHGEEVTHSCPHEGKDVNGPSGEIPEADRALDTLLFLNPERPVVEGALRFHDPMPFDPGQVVQLTLSAKGNGRYRGSKREWNLGSLPDGLRLGDLETAVS